MGKPKLDFETMARRTHEALGEMLDALGSEFADGETEKAEALQAMAAGAIKRAVQFTFNASALLGQQPADALRHLGNTMLDEWNEAVQNHIRALAAKRPGETVQ